MKRKTYILLPLLGVAAPLMMHAGERLIPAGSLIQCTISESKLSSKTTEVGDPILCQVNHVAGFGRSAVPYGSYLVGRFEDYQDPGHFVGKGWVELKFDRLVIPPDTEIGLTAKVVNVPKYPVDKQGKVDGKGHPVRDTIEWTIPVLWPIDLINLPRRGPRPVLKAETRLTLKLMDDIGVPMQQATYSPNYTQPAPPPRDSYGFGQRTPAPMSYAPAPATQAPVPRSTAYVAPVIPVMPVWRAPAPPPVVLMFRDGNQRLATDYWFENAGQVRYIAMNGDPVMIPIEALDLIGTVEMNRRRGITFTIRSAWQ